MQVIQKNWLDVFLKELQRTDVVRIVSPFISEHIVDLLLHHFHGSKIQVITRYNLNDYGSGVSSLTAIEKLVKAKADVRGVRALHSKLYLFDQKSALIASANFTSGGFFKNLEFGVLSDDSAIVSQSQDYFDKLWKLDPQPLQQNQIDQWRKEIENSRANTPKVTPLPDYGQSYIRKKIGTKRYFIKIFGTKDDRASLGYSTKEEIEESHCHYALSFSRRKNDGRPTRYRDGDVVFMATMLHGHNYAIFGRGICYSHHHNRDIADADDIKAVSWRGDWPILVRVHSTRFIDSTMGNCPTMADLIGDLSYQSFKNTLVRHESGERNINPLNSLRQKPDVWLSEMGALWCEQRFEDTLKNLGEVPYSYVNQFYQGKPI